MQRLATAVLAVAVTATGCSNSSASPSEETRLTVFAAASLGSAFNEIAEEFERAHGDIDIVLSFTGSNTLASQMIEGAPADVFASADPITMERAVDAEAVGPPQTFASNSMEIIVAADNPHGIDGIGSLADPDLSVVMCDPEVPCGNYAQQLLKKAEVDIDPASLEANVNGVSTKVINGEADAGIAYSSTVADSADLADGVVIPDDMNIVAEYQIAVADDAALEAAQFLDYVMSDDGQRILATHGFSTA